MVASEWHDALHAPADGDHAAATDFARDAVLPGGDDERVLILAPRGRNAELISNALDRAGFRTLVCPDSDHLCREILKAAGAVVLCEEALNSERLACLVDTLHRQPAWSELPLLVLTGAGKTTRYSFQIAQELGPRGNATLIERPVRIITLVSAVRTALRARRRQYEVRDLLAREHTARASAEAASNAKDHFLATLSHELRTPLNPVLMTVTAMAQDPSLPPAYRDDLDVIKRNVELESSLIDDLLDLTRIARGKLELRQEAVDLHALLGQAVSTCESEIRRKRLNVRIDATAASHYVWGDPARLAQVFWNLLTNAVKFTPASGSVTLATQSPDGPGSVTVSVIDTGIGIEPDAAARIFDAFEQANRGITRRFGGLGLGLAISKAIVEGHGGAIGVHSHGRGKGAEFSVRLVTIPEPARNAPPAEHKNGDGQAGLRILLVEDHEATADVMSRLLRALSFVVTVAHDVETAKRLADQDPFDLLISDIGLPDGSGLDLVRHLRARRPIPALAVSGYGMEEDIRQSREAGFIDHLVKPVDLNKLRAGIERVLADAKRA